MALVFNEINNQIPGQLIITTDRITHQRIQIMLKCLQFTNPYYFKK